MSLPGRLLVLALVAACGGRTQAETPWTGPPDTVAIVDGEPVVAREVEFARASTSPSLLPPDVTTAAIRRKVQQIILKEQGLVHEISYATFVERFHAENERRQDARRRGIPIYGPTEFGEREYFEYVFTTSVIQLKESLPGLAGSEDALRRDYARHVARFRSGRVVKTAVFTIRYDRTSSTARQTAWRAMEALRIRLQREPGSVTQLGHAAPMMTSMRTYGGERADMSRLNAMDPLHNAAMAMSSVGDLSEVMVTPEGMSLLACTGFSDGAPRSFEEVRAQLQHLHIDEAFEHLVDRRLAQATIVRRPSAPTEVGSTNDETAGIADLR